MFSWQLLLWKWIKEIFTVIIVRLLKGKDASLDNSMLNHPGHVPLTSWIFKNFLPVAGNIQICKPWKYWPLTPSGSEFMVFLKNDKLMMIGEPPSCNNFLNNFCLKSRLVSKILMSLFCDFGNSKMTSKLP